MGLLPVAAPRTLVLPPLHGASWKIHDEEPEQGDDEEPHADHQELPDLRRQSLPLCHASAAVQGTKRIVASAVKRSPLTSSAVAFWCLAVRSGTVYPCRRSVRLSGCHSHEMEQ